MSRYYNIEIRKPGQTAVFRQYTSYPMVGSGFQNDPGALNVILDAFVTTGDVPIQQAILQIWGVSLSDLMQSNNFTGCLIKVYAGFQKGLPLNNPAQAGLILSGMIFQSYGNWQGTDMTLDFVIVTAGSTSENPVNISFNWQEGSTLATALQTCLGTAFPGVALTINISDKLVLNHDEAGTYDSLVPFAQTIKNLTQPIIGGSYPGVTITMLPTGLAVTDAGVIPGSSTSSTASTSTAPTETTKPVTAPPSPPTQIAFQDFIGQPTWIGPYVIQFACPMRHDINVGDMVAMPKGVLGSASNTSGSPGAVVTSSASQPQIRQQTIFSGTFQVYQVHHLGNFRQPDGQSWVTVFDAAFQAPAS